MKKKAFMITFAGLFLPYRLRIIYGFFVNFMLNSVFHNISIFMQLISGAIIGTILSFVYFIIIPITIIMQVMTKGDKDYIMHHHSDTGKRY